MTPKKLRVPKPVLHKPSGQAAVFLRQPDGKRHMVYLGEHGSAAAERAYRRVLSDYLADKPIEPKSRAGRAPGDAPTIAQLCAAFLLHAESYYRDPRGLPSGEVSNFRLALRPLLQLHRDTPIAEFSIRDLVEVRRVFLDEEFGCAKDGRGRPIPGTGKSRTRNYINACLRRIKQVFRWGTEQQIVPGSVWHELSAFRSLPKGRCGARETDPVEAVPWSQVEPVLQHLTKPLAACVRLQWASGMRPSEALRIRMSDIDRSGDVWLYHIPQHKNAWRNTDRTVALGPEAREVIRPFLRVDGGFLFSPRDAAAETKTAKRAARKTPMTPSQRARDERNAAKSPIVGDHYHIDAYRKAIHRACDRAGVPRWSPHRLRHARGTELAKTEGIEVARIALGHKDDRVTRRYARAAELDLAIEVARRHG